MVTTWWSPQLNALLGSLVVAAGAWLAWDSFSPWGVFLVAGGVAGFLIWQGAHGWTGLGLGHPVAWPGEPCVAHRHNGSGPLDHDGTDRRTNGDDPLSRCDGTPLGDLLDNDLLWALQASRPAPRRPIKQCNRQPSTHAAIRTPAQTQIRPTTSRSDRRRHRT